LNDARNFVDRVGTRPGGAPVLAGDVVDGEKVKGFAFVVPARDERACRAQDRLLVAGDEALASPPARAVPVGVASESIGVDMPPAGLPDGRVFAAEEVRAGLADDVRALLARPNAPWQALANELLSTVAEAGHALWISGGAARDLVHGLTVEEVNDLDLSGTAPPGHFTELAYSALRAAGLSECEQTVTPKSLVCAARVPGADDRMIEYRSLALRGYQFPATGSDLEEDSGHRDFAFNALHYDALTDVVIDSTGHGVNDVIGPMVLRPVLNLNQALREALVVLRGAKFKARWREDLVDVEPFSTWTAGLRWSLDELTPADWAALEKQYRESAAGKEPELAAAARELGPKADGLVRELCSRVGGIGA